MDVSVWNTYVYIHILHKPFNHHSQPRQSYVYPLVLTFFLTIPTRHRYLVGELAVGGVFPWEFLQQKTRNDQFVLRKPLNHHSQPHQRYVYPLVLTLFLAIPTRHLYLAAQLAVGGVFPWEFLQQKTRNDQFVVRKPLNHHSRPRQSYVYLLRHRASLPKYKSKYVYFVGRFFC